MYVHTTLQLPTVYVQHMLLNNNCCYNTCIITVCFILPLPCLDYNLHLILQTESKKITLQKLHKPVRWWTDWKPRPNRPTFSCSSSFWLWCILPMFFQSSSLKTLLFQASRAGPWKGARVCFHNPPGSRGCWRESIRNLTLLAPASSAFWISSCWKKKWNIHATFFAMVEE